MKSSFFACLMIVLGATYPLAAQNSGKKSTSSPKASAAAGKGTQANSASKSDDAKPDDAEKPAANKKSDKKAGNQGGSIKLSTGAAKKPADEKEVVRKLSYMQGFSLGKQIAQFQELGIQIDLDVVIEALRAAVTTTEPAMTDEEMREASAAIQNLLQEKAAAKNKRDGEDFLAKNKKEDGVKTLPSGLQYKVLKSGKGESPKKTDTVKAHYQGSFLNGQIFDSSYRRGQPVSFPLNQVIKGWTEALQLMKVGDKWQLFIPAELAYEENGKQDQQGNPVIPPNATLIFEVELLGVEKGSKLPSLK